VILHFPKNVIAAAAQIRATILPVIMVHKKSSPKVSFFMQTASRGICVAMETEYGTQATRVTTGWEIRGCQRDYCHIPQIKQVQFPGLLVIQIKMQ